MQGVVINKLILEKLQSAVKEDDVRNFVIDVLKIEQESGRFRMKDYEKTLAKYVHME